jgi:hypothetical protein
MLSGGVNASIGQGIYRDIDAPELANQTNWSANVRVRPSQRLEFNTSFNYARMRSRERVEELFAGYVLRTRTNVNFTRSLSVRLVVQYNDFSERVDVEPLLTYRVNPFTVFYVGTPTPSLTPDSCPCPRLPRLPGPAQAPARRPLAARCPTELT